MTDRINATTTWAFDAAGNELSMTDAENQATVYGYDNSGRRVTIQWPDHVAGQIPGGANYGIEATAYDEAGRKLRSTNQLGDTITHIYDMGSRLLKKEYRTLANSPSGTISSQDTFTYDARSRMLTGVKGLYSNTVTMAYDVGGRKSSESLTIAGQTYTVGTAYDTAGRVSQLTYPDGSVVVRTYDSRNLLSTISLAGTNINSRAYDTGGRLSSETLGNGLVVTRTYTTGDNTPLAISNSVVGTYTYGWDANKNKTDETITGVMSGYTSTMGFDDQNRLTSWNRSNGNSQAWTLSAVNDWQSFTNNGTAVARTHGPTHEVLTVGSATITHDSRGNMTSDEFAIMRTYDVENKVTQAVVSAGSARGIAGTHTYQYDVLGRRVRKTIGGTNASDTVYALSGEQIVADYAAGTAASSPTTRYIRGSHIDELVCQAVGSAKLYPHRNQQFSTVALSDASGTVAERYAYTSYGDLTVLDSAGTTVRTIPPQTRYTYTGREYDQETGTYHFRARIYSATMGRFTGHDPILYPSGANTYAGWFIASRRDPRGHQSEPVEPSPTGGENGCKMKVCMNEVANVGGHLFIVLDLNPSWAYRGGPSPPEGEECKLKGDQLHGDDGEYNPDFIDHYENEAHPTGKENCKEYQVAGNCQSLHECFKRTLSAINNCCIPYNPIPVLDNPLNGVGANSNSTVMWMLSNCVNGGTGPIC